MSSARPKVVLLGSMFRHPVPGVVYQLLHYLVGLERLGFEAYYVECHGDRIDEPTAIAAQRDTKRLNVVRVLDEFGFGQRWSCLNAADGESANFGPLAATDLVALYRDTKALLNIAGAHHLTDAMMACPVRIYVESDPGVPQIGVAGHDAVMRELLAAHTHLATFGELIGRPGCRLPDLGLTFLNTRQPVVMDMWSDTVDASSAVTTIATWRKGNGKSIEHDGSSYSWDESRSFLEFIDLPAGLAHPMILSLARATAEDVEILEASGWQVEDATRRNVSIKEYRQFIASSYAEFAVAKQQHVRLRTGWFSDRSACYLAAGRPVVIQDTGFGEVLPTGAGLFSYSDEDDIITAFDELDRTPSLHREAARDLAYAYFDSDVVLTDLFGACGIAVPKLSKHRRHAISHHDAGLHAALNAAGIQGGVANGRRLGTDRVWRIESESCERASVIAKRTAIFRARNARFVASELLPRYELNSLVPQLLADGQGNRSGFEVWQIFEDLDQSSLASRTTGSDASRPADLGLLSPLGALVADLDLERVVVDVARLHGSLTGAAELLRLPRLDMWFIQSAIAGAKAELGRLRRGVPAWAVLCDQLLSHLERSSNLVENEGIHVINELPTTLLHGDLGLNNIVVTDARVSLVDWDHAGRGPAGYDLSTLLAQLAPGQRLRAVELYRAHNPAGISADLASCELECEVFERARIATVVRGTGRVHQSDPRWARARLEECLRWFEGIAPLCSQVGALG